MSEGYETIEQNTQNSEHTVKYPCYNVEKNSFHLNYSSGSLTSLSKGCNKAKIMQIVCASECYSVICLVECVKIRNYDVFTVFSETVHNFGC